MYKQLTREQRYTIDILLKQKQRKKDIAQAIGVHPSTITREINRNKSKRGGYSYEMANELSEERKFRLKILIRQYIPKKTSFGSLSTNYIKDVQMKINRRPREKLSFRCPKQVFFKNFL